MKRVYLKAPILKRGLWHQIKYKASVGENVNGEIRPGQRIIIVHVQAAAAGPNCAPCSEGRKRLFDQTSATRVSSVAGGLLTSTHEPEFCGRSVWREFKGEGFLEPSEAGQTLRANRII